MELNKTYYHYDRKGNVISTITKTVEHVKCSLETMSKDCRKSLFDHLDKYRNDWHIGNNIEETKKSIMLLPSFVSGCFTYLQAQVLAEHIHTKEFKNVL